MGFFVFSGTRGQSRRNGGSAFKHIGVYFAAAMVLSMSPVRAQNSAHDELSSGLTGYRQSVAEHIGSDSGLAAFYRDRKFAPIWTAEDSSSKDRLSALLSALADADRHGLPLDVYDRAGWISRLSNVSDDRALGQIEVELSKLYLSFAHDLQSGLIDNPGRIDSDIKRRAPRRGSEDLLTRIATEPPRHVFQTLAPQTPEYLRLMREKIRLERVIARGGWGETVYGERLELGDTGSNVVALRDRLVAMGFMSASLEGQFDAKLQSALRAFQTAHGLSADGVAGPATLAAVNVSATDRLKSILVAMERERWLNLPEGRGERHIWVNLVDFHARILDDGKTTFSTRSVIGHRDEDRRSPEFSDVMEHMVINPTWYVPRSIIVNEYLPKLRSNSGAVSHLDVVDRNGRVVDRSVSFAEYTEKTFPFSMRQPPGPKNALGTVKFMFPNQYNIYLHDTPAKNLFSREVRAFSHGCIRLADPHDFAYAILARQMDAPEAYFQAVLRSERETRVKLKQQIPVHLVYRTAYTQAKGPVQYRGDIYGRDAKIWTALNRLGVVLGQVGS